MALTVTAAVICFLLVSAAGPANSWGPDWKPPPAAATSTAPWQPHAVTSTVPAPWQPPTVSSTVPAPWQPPAVTSTVPAPWQPPAVTSTVPAPWQPPAVSSTVPPPWQPPAVTSTVPAPWQPPAFTSIPWQPHATSTPIVNEEESIIFDIFANVMSTNKVAISTVTPMSTKASLNQSAIAVTLVVTKDKVQKSMTTSLTPSATPNERPADDSTTTIVVAAIFTAIVILVAVTIALMMIMLSSRSCHCSRKNKFTDEHTAGTSNSFLFSPVPITNVALNRYPVPSVTSFVPVIPQPQEDEHDYDLVTGSEYYDSVYEGTQTPGPLPTRQNTSSIRQPNYPRRITLLNPLHSHGPLPTTAAVNAGFIVVDNHAYGANGRNH